ncbi:MAG TPA: nuclear transport factor 2 family protein, partial [Pyrinomonadaceae bacterium]|nr:nuclear transport factor 2 family protein [Pyrinomonadaceae bacterium]
MSVKNKQIVEKVNAAFSENKPEGFLDACADNVEWTIVGDQSFKGKDAIRKFMSSMKGQEPPKFTVEETIAEGDSVVCYGTMKMADDKGIVGDYSYVDAYRFSGDK